MRPFTPYVTPYETIAQELGVSRGEVRAIERRALINFAKAAKKMGLNLRELLPLTEAHDPALPDNDID